MISHNSAIDGQSTNKSFNLVYEKGVISPFFCIFRHYFAYLFFWSFQFCSSNSSEGLFVSFVRNWLESVMISLWTLIIWGIFCQFSILSIWKPKHRSFSYKSSFSVLQPSVGAIGEFSTAIAAYHLFMDLLRVDQTWSGSALGA